MKNSTAYSRFIPPHFSERRFIASRQEKARQIAGILSVHVPPRSAPRVLDVGCHEGTITASLAAVFPHITGIDADGDAITRARARFGDTCDFVTASAQALPFADDSVDIVILNHVLYYLPDPAAAMAEVRRVLVDDGICYVAVNNGAWFNQRQGLLAEKLRRFVNRCLFPAADDCGRPVAYADYRACFGNVAVVDIIQAMAENSKSYPRRPGVVGRIVLPVLGRLPAGMRRHWLQSLPSFIFIIQNRESGCCSP